MATCLSQNNQQDKDHSWRHHPVEVDDTLNKKKIFKMYVHIICVRVCRNTWSVNYLWDFEKQIYQ